MQCFARLGAGFACLQNNYCTDKVDLRPWSLHGIPLGFPMGREATSCPCFVCSTAQGRLEVTVRSWTAMSLISHVSGGLEDTPLIRPVLMDTLLSFDAEVTGSSVMPVLYFRMHWVEVERPSFRSEAEITADPRLCNGRIMLASCVSTHEAIPLPKLAASGSAAARLASCKRCYRSTAPDPLGSLRAWCL